MFESWIVFLIYINDYGAECALQLYVKKGQWVLFLFIIRISCIETETGML